MKNNEQVIFERTEAVGLGQELRFQYESSIGRKFFRNKRKLFNKFSERKQMVIFADDYVSNKILSYGLYEKKQLELIFEWLGTKKNIFNSTVLDIGANIGNHSLYFSGYFSKCISFEPNPRTFSVLEINSRLVDNIIPMNLGLSDKKCTASLYTSFRNVGGSSLSGDRNAVVDNKCDIQLDRIDDIISNEENVGLMKMDVEGHEWFAIKGGEKVIKKNKPIIIFEHNTAKENNDMDVISLLNSYGYHDFYEVVDGWEHLNKSLGRYPRYVRFLIKYFLIFGGKKILHRIVRINAFSKKQYLLVIAQAG
ncbi:MAG: FkbM family methyltransferase [Acidiferrobacterales bacterium]